VTLLHMLDTDMSSYIIKKRPDAVAARLAELPPSTVCISVITRAELFYGLRRLPSAHRLHAGVREFLRLVHVLDWGSDAADHYADIRHRLTIAGRLIGEMDMMIAAHALAVNAILVTNNTRHYTRIDLPLRLVNWIE
jgi:tRNA(fMet)-specific endonuclease VapC